MGGPDSPKNINYKLVEIHGVACEMFKVGLLFVLVPFLKLLIKLLHCSLYFESVVCTLNL